MKRLIINADDFGLHESINAAVEKAHKEGILTSASLAPCGLAFSQAEAIAKRNNNLGVGVHFCLNGERPVTDAGKIPTLVGRDGLFFESHALLFKMILTGKTSLEHVAIELGAQLEKFFAAGLVPTHADSHRHVHLFGPVFKVFSRILRKRGVTKIRSLNVPPGDFGGADIKGLLFLLFSRVRGAEFKRPDYFIGFFKSGKIDAGYLRKSLRCLKKGVTEINFHPGLDNKAIEESYPAWRREHNWPCAWEREFALLVEPATREIVKEEKISLINYSGL